MKDEHRRLNIKRAIWFMYLTEEQLDDYLKDDSRLTLDENQEIATKMCEDFKALTNEIKDNGGYFAL